MVFNLLKKWLFKNSKKTLIPNECDLDKYNELLSNTPSPSEQQIENFIEYVFNAHSWYKHIPLFPPGVDFCFYLDPNAGRDIIRYKNGKIGVVDVTDEDEFFHNISNCLQIVNNLFTICKQFVNYWNYKSILIIHQKRPTPMARGVFKDKTNYLSVCGRASLTLSSRLSSSLPFHISIAA